MVKKMNKIYYSYLRDYKNNRHVTIARRTDKQAKTVAYGVAVSHPDDQFCKYVGRYQAEANLSDKPKLIELTKERPIICVLKDLTQNNDSVAKLATLALGLKPSRKKKSSVPPPERFELKNFDVTILTVGFVTFILLLASIFSQFI